MPLTTHHAARWALALGISFHFSLLAMGMLRVDLPEPALEWQRNYARITGAGGSFGFFSPDVPRELEVTFELDTGGAKKIVELRDSFPPEVQARVTNMVHLIDSHFRDPKVLRALAASFTAAMFRQYPEAKSIRFVVRYCGLPELVDYREGKRAEPKIIYSAKFKRRAET